jgi:uncharacterized protein with PQ loop repeat
MTAINLSLASSLALATQAAAIAQMTVFKKTKNGTRISIIAFFKSNFGTKGHVNLQKMNLH